MLDVIFEDVADRLLVYANIGSDRQEWSTKTLSVDELHQAPRCKAFGIEIGNGIKLCSRAVLASKPRREIRRVIGCP